MSNIQPYCGKSNNYFPENVHMAAWYIVIFENCIEAQFIASMNFANELYSAFMNNPVHIDGARYFYKHTDEQSIYYLSPEAAVISPDLLNKYGAALLLNEPDVTDLEMHIL